MFCFSDHAAISSRVPFESLRKISALRLVICLLAMAGGQSSAAPGDETGACCDQLGDVCLEGLTKEECEADQFDERRFGGVGSTCATIEPSCESCEDVCPSCAVKQGEGTRRAVISLVAVESVGLDTRFTYHLCQDAASQNLSHWVLGLTPECCLRITASDGGSSPVTQCAVDPTTGLFGLKFQTDGGVGSCGIDECSDGGTLFSVQLTGAMDTSCVKAVNKINGSPASAFGCVQGPKCEPCETDADCNNNEPCSRTETCNESGVCILRTEIHDCNANGVEDLCDIANGSSRDCSGNGVPDECELADCAGEPECDDCNLNGVPDGCDIDSGGWLDVDPADGIPDACVDPSGVGGDWTDDIWNLADENPKNPYPDNGDGVGNLHVTIDGFTVFLNDAVEIQTLRLLNSGTLLVTQCEIGDFATAAVGGILNEGNLLVGGDRRIDVGGSDLTLGPGGRYAAISSTCATVCPSGAVCASLTGRDVFLTAGDCASLRSGGDMVIDQSMSVELSGDLVLLGNPFFGCEAGRAVQPRGINVFPKFRVSEPALVSADDVELDGVSSSENSSTAVAASGDIGIASGFSVFGVRMRGDFVNHSIAPSLFDWVTGYLATVGTEQVFEVAGIDFGPSEEGFETARDTLFDSGTHFNFAIGTLEVRPGSHLTFVNDFANTVGDGPCEEAFYVKRLILHAGATLTLNDVNVYYESLENGGGVIETLGCGALQGLCNPQTAETDSVAKNRFISITTGIPGRQQAIRVILDDLPAPFDTLNGQVMWVGEPTAINESASTVAPEPGAESFWASQLQCTPYFTDWSAVGTVQVYHQAVVPGGSYPIQIVDQSCASGSEVDFSEPLDMSMAVFGDIVGTCSTDSCSPPNGVVDILDLFAVINAFASVPGTVSKVRADIEPAVPDFIINISDALVVVDAFAGVPYPFPPPQNPCGNR